jgi:hypothetical protein
VPKFAIRTDCQNLQRLPKFAQTAKTCKDCQNLQFTKTVPQASTFPQIANTQNLQQFAKRVPNFAQCASKTPLDSHSILFSDEFLLWALVLLANPRPPNECHGVDAEYANVEEKLDKVLLVELSDAVVDPGAVVVHLPDAPLADAAVVRSRGTVRLTPVAHRPRRVVPSSSLTN